jgi:hypothetical protein
VALEPELPCEDMLDSDDDVARASDIDFDLCFFRVLVAMVRVPEKKHMELTVASGAARSWNIFNSRSAR